MTTLLDDSFNGAAGSIVGRVPPNGFGGFAWRKDGTTRPALMLDGSGGLSGPSNAFGESCIGPLQGNGNPNTAPTFGRFFQVDMTVRTGASVGGASCALTVGAIDLNGDPTVIDASYYLNDGVFMSASWNYGFYSDLIAGAFATPAPNTSYPVRLVVAADGVTCTAQGATFFLAAPPPPPSGTRQYGDFNFLELQIQNASLLDLSVVEIGTESDPAFWTGFKFTKEIP
jgi:hypothetical protein